MTARRKAERAVKRLLVADTLEDLFKGGAEERRITVQVLADLAGSGGRYRKVAERVAGRSGVSYHYLRDRAMVFTASIAEIRSHDLFRRLGVPPSATFEEIRKRWREVVKETHPDTPGGDSEVFRQTRAAYEALADPASRAVYDGYWAKQIAPVEQAIVLASSPLPPRRGLRRWRRWGRILHQHRGRILHCKSVVMRSLEHAVSSSAAGIKTAALLMRRLLDRVRTMGRAVKGFAFASTARVRRSAIASCAWGLRASQPIAAGIRRIGRSGGHLVFAGSKNTAAGVKAAACGLGSTLAAAIEKLTRASLVSLACVKGIWLGVRHFAGRYLLDPVARAAAAVFSIERKQIASLVVFTTAFVVATALVRNWPSSSFWGNGARIGAVGEAGEGPRSSADGTLAALFLGERSWVGSSVQGGLAFYEGDASGGNEAFGRRSEAATAKKKRRGEGLGERRGAVARPIALSERRKGSEPSSDQRGDVAPREPGTGPLASRPRDRVRADLPSVEEARASARFEKAPRPKDSEPPRPRAEDAKEHASRTIQERKGASHKPAFGRKRAALVGSSAGRTETREPDSKPVSRPLGRALSASTLERPLETQSAAGAPSDISKRARTPEEVTSEEALLFVELFRKRYEELDAARLSALFAHDASENGVAGREWIAAEYKRAFEALQSVRYLLGRAEVRPLGPWADVAAPFTIAYRDTAGRYGEVAGRAHWWLVRDGSELKVLRLEYEIERRVN